MRWLLSASMALLLIAPCARTDDDSKAKAKAKAALFLAQSQRERALKADAKASVLKMLAKVQHERDEGACMTDLHAAIAKSEKTHKPLFLWIGMTCDKEVRGAFSDAVHCHIEALNGDDSPRLIVGAKQPNLRMHKSEINQDTVPRIKSFLQKPAKISYAPSAPVFMQSC